MRDYGRYLRDGVVVAQREAGPWHARDAQRRHDELVGWLAALGF